MSGTIVHVDSPFDKADIRLPTLIATINSRYEIINDDLERLGKEPSNDPTSEMMNLVTSFTATLAAKTSGHPGHEAFMQDIKAAFEKYKREIWATAPRFTPFSTSAIKANPDLLKVDYVSGIEELKEGAMGSGGTKGRMMNLDDIREHIKK